MPHTYTTKGGSFDLGKDDNEEGADTKSWLAGMGLFLDQALVLDNFGSDRSSRSLNVCVSVLSGKKLV